MEQLASFQFTEDRNVKTQNQRTFARKYQEILITLLLIVNILTIGFGYVFFKKVIATLAVDEIRQRVDQNENLSSRIVENISRADEYILDMVKRTHAIEAIYNSLEEKVSALMNKTAEMEKVDQENNNRTSLQQENLFDTNVTVLDLKRRMDQQEAVNNDLHSKVTDFVKVYANLEKIHQRFDEYENTSSQLVKSISGIDNQVLDMKKHIDAEEAAKSVLEKTTWNVIKPYERSRAVGFMNVSAEIKEMRQRVDKDENLSSQLLKNISTMDKQTLNMTKRIDAVEAAKNVLENKFSESLKRTHAEGRVIWKIDDYKSKIAQLGSRGLKIFYGPPFYTSQFGYKMRLICELTKSYITTHIGCLKDDCRILMERPFVANITYFTSDGTSKQPEYHVNTFTKESECAQTTWTKISQDQTYIKSPCYAITLRVENNAIQRDYVVDNTVYLGVEVESNIFAYL